jgi:hypothetical protein
LSSEVNSNNSKPAAQAPMWQLYSQGRSDACHAASPRPGLIAASAISHETGYGADLRAFTDVLRWHLPDVLATAIG